MAELRLGSIEQTTGRLRIGEVRLEGSRLAVRRADVCEHVLRVGSPVLAIELGNARIRRVVEAEVREGNARPAGRQRTSRCGADAVVRPGDERYVAGKIEGGALGDMAQTLVRRVGVEPTTDGLKARCSTTELTPLSEGTYSDAACERRGCDEGSVCAYLQGLNGHDGSSVEWPVDVREELRTPFEVLVVDLGVHSFRRDRQHDKIRASAEDGVRDGQYLLRSGTVDEAF